PVLRGGRDVAYGDTGAGSVTWCGAVSHVVADDQRSQRRICIWPSGCQRNTSLSHLRGLWGVPLLGYGGFIAGFADLFESDRVGLYILAGDIGNPVTL